MIHRLFTAPLRCIPCSKPRIEDAAQRDSYETGKTASTSLPAPKRLRAISEGRPFTAGGRAERGLKEAEAAQGRGESIWPWLDALPISSRSDHSKRWAALVLRESNAAPQRLANPERVSQWFEAAWRASNYDLALANWLAQRGGAIPVRLTAFAGLLEVARLNMPQPPGTLGSLPLEDDLERCPPELRATAGALFARLPTTERAALLGDGPQQRFSPEQQRAIVSLLPAASHALVARTWLAHRGCSMMPTCTVQKLRILNNLLAGCSPTGKEYVEFPELALLRHRDEVPIDALPPWARAWLPPETPGTDEGLTPRERSARALSRFLFACRVAEIPTATRDAAKPLVMPLLALPDEALRSNILWRLAAALSDPQQTAAVMAMRQQAPVKALPLRLTAQLFYPELAGEPGLQAVLQTRSLFAHGPHARTLMQLMTARGQQAFASQALALTRPSQLRKVVDGPAQAQAIDAALSAAQRAAATGNARATADERNAALALLDKHQARAQALSTVRAQLSAESKVPPAAATLKPTLEALRRAFTWLTTQPGLDTVAPLAMGLYNAQAHGGAHAAKALSQCETALATRRPAVEGWQATWCAALLRDLRSLLPPQLAHSEGTAAGAAPKPTSGRAGKCVYPTAAMRAVLADQVTPLLLALAEYAPLLREAGLGPQNYSQAQQVLPSCLQWTGFTHAQLRDLVARSPDLHHVALYQASMSAFKPRHGETGMERVNIRTAGDARRVRALLKKLLQAQLHGRLDAARREGAQAKLLLQDPGGEALMQAWERCARVPATLQGHTIEDTGELGAMLAAVTTISSCLSAHGGSRNQGMMSRISDGAKRMLVLHDAGGKLRARAMLRLMRTHDGRAVLMLSKLYTATGTCSEDAESAVHAYVRQRALALGVQAVCNNSQHTQLPPAGFPLLTCESAPGDYWDELRKLSTEPAQLMRTFRELAPAPGTANRLQ